MMAMQALFLILMLALLAGCEGADGMSLRRVKATPIPILTLTLKPKTTPVPSTVPLTASTILAPTIPAPSVVPSAVSSVVPLPTRTILANPGAPYPNAPLCPGEHDYSLFHTLWNSAQGCHYDHEHGDNPFTSEVAAAFPGFDLKPLLGGVEIGHSNPSSPMENVHKHGGFKWQAQPVTPQGCVTGFENAQFGVNGAAILYHAFGNYGIELEARIHSTAALVRQCVPGSNDYGYLFTIQHQEYGQRVSPYQGTLLPYPDNPSLAYGGGFGPYLTTDCIGTGIPTCRTSRDFIISRNLNTNSIWTSKPTGTGIRPQTSRLFRLLFRVRDTYQVFNSADLVHPFTYTWLCSSENGASYDPSMPGCRWNNTTTRVHEVAGDIPAAWDNLADFDTDPRPGRVTAEGYTDRFGALDLTCNEPSGSCFPLKLAGAYVGRYGGELSPVKVSNPDPVSNPERDFYFCGGAVCAETAPGAVPSGWVGAEN